MPLMTYLARYGYYIISRKSKFEFCKLEMVFDEELIVEENYNLIIHLSHGGRIYQPL